MTKRTINPPALFNSTQYGFSQAVVCESGRTIFISGQVAWDKDQHIVGTNLETQTRQALHNLTVAVESAGGTLDGIVMLRIYVVNGKETDLEPVGLALRDHFGTRNLPASTWISVQGLARPEFFIEIEAQAVL